MSLYIIRAMYSSQTCYERTQLFVCIWNRCEVLHRLYPTSSYTQCIIFASFFSSERRFPFMNTWTFFFHHEMEVAGHHINFNQFLVLITHLNVSIVKWCYTYTLHSSFCKLYYFCLESWGEVGLVFRCVFIYLFIISYLYECLIINIDIILSW